MLKAIRNLVLVGFFAVSGLAHAERVGDFALLDQTGRHYQMSYFGDHEAVVLLAHSTDASFQAQAEAYRAAAAGIADEFKDKNVLFLFLNSRQQDSRADLAELATSVPILVDESQLVAESLGISRIGEALVFDPETMQLLYKGAGDVVQDVVSAHLRGTAVPEALAATGSQIEFGGPQQGISYVADIAPMLEENCVACHYEGGIGPWAMNSHAMVRGWSMMMREVVMNRRMPPGQIDTHVGKPIHDVAGLTIEEQQKLIRWIDAGAPIDGTRDPLAELKVSNAKFSLGEPDLIYTVPAQDIPATGVIDYRYVPVELNLDKDVWVQAMEFVPGDREVLHHVIAYVQSPTEKSVRGKDTGADQGENMAGFAPGRQPDQFHDDSGRLLRKGSNLLLQMHYTTSGRETVDETQVGIYLHDKPPEHVMSGGVAGQRRFMIPAHAKEHKLRGEQEVERDAYLYQMTPHMHFRGRYMTYSVEYPDGKTELLLSVPKYDFNWQFSYRLVEPVFLPAGSKIVAEGAMDNSDRNPANPDPSKPVLFGLQTKHEMFFGFTTLRYVGDTPASIAQGDLAQETSSAGME
ncbi:MAG: redoxin domain-containing protein [Pseudomonadota bacterium]